jgi:Domain of unknown function (DUF4394)
MSNLRFLLPAAAVAAAALTVQSAQATEPAGPRVFGLSSDNALIRFDATQPRRERFIGYITGFDTDTQVVGIDFRVQDGLLYAVGNQGGIYTVDTKNAQATLVERLDITLIGTSFGVDFNPAADALRVISDTGQNLRHPFSGPTQFVTQDDMFLRNPPVPPAVAVPRTGIAAAAYTNNDLSLETGTTLFDLDLALDQVVIQSPANSGNVVLTGTLRVDGGAVAGFDIYSRLSKGIAVQNQGYAALAVGEAYRFFRVNLLTGRASSVGQFDVPVFDIAVELD